MRASTQRPRGGLDLVEQIRAHGPFEDWRARPSPKLGLSKWVVARRASPDRDDLAALAARLTRAARTADEVSHHLVMPTQGTLETHDGAIVQLSADVDGIDLERCPVSAPPAPRSAAVWIARQLLEALAHAHALGVTHRNISPAAVWLGRAGGVQLDFGLSTTDADMQEMLTTSVDLQFTHPEWAAEASYQPKQDVYGVLAILWLLVTGRPYRRSVAKVVHRPASVLRPEVPAALEDVFRVGLGVDLEAPAPEAGALAERLDRVFYGVLNAEDDRDGSHAITEWIRDIVPRRCSDDDSGDSDLAAESIQGRFTRALAARAAPVRPGDLTESDVDLDGHDLGRVAPVSGSFGRVDVPARLAPGKPIPPASTEPWTQIPVRRASSAPTQRPGTSERHPHRASPPPAQSASNPPTPSGYVKASGASQPPVHPRRVSMRSEPPVAEAWDPQEAPAAARPTELEALPERGRARESWAPEEAPAAARPTELEALPERGRAHESFPATNSDRFAAPTRGAFSRAPPEPPPQRSEADMILPPATEGLWFRSKWFVLGFGITTALLLFFRWM